MQPERFIPFRKTDVIDLCASGTALGPALGAALGPADAARFRTFATLLSDYVHHEFRARLERLKDAYALFDPDPETRRLVEPSADERAHAAAVVEEGLRELLVAANFVPIGEAEIADALARESLMRIRLVVDFEDFAQVLFYWRGATESTATVRTWLGLRRREVRFTSYGKVVVFVTFKDADYFAARGRRDLPFEPGATHIKLFQRVPRADLEMLLPNTEVRLRTIDKVLIGVPAAVSFVIVLSTKLLTSLGLALLLLAFLLGFREEPVVLDQAALVALGAGLGSLGAYLWKQFNKFKNRRIQFLKALTDNLYFRNLDNDAGVFHHLLDAAEEEEVKEAVLAYRFLLSGGPLDPRALDAVIESWFRASFDADVDFDVDDGVAKLVRLGLVEEQEGRLAARPLDEAIARIDALWDDVFDAAAESAADAVGRT